MAKPNEFYVGVIDLFAILLPGAIAVAILEPRYGELIYARLITEPESALSRGVVFLALSYFIGHLIFLIGSYLDPCYNQIRKRLSPDDINSAFKRAERIRDTIIDEPDRVSVNTFQWSRSVLLNNFPAAADDVHRLEADSKFFRSLVVVSLFASAAFVSSGQNVEAGFALLLVVPCFVRYYERRRKSTRQAYIHIITLAAMGKLI